MAETIDVIGLNIERGRRVQLEMLMLNSTLCHFHHVQTPHAFNNLMSASRYDRYQICLIDRPDVVPQVLSTFMRLRTDDTSNRRAAILIGDGMKASVPGKFGRSIHVFDHHVDTRSLHQYIQLLAQNMQLFARCEQALHFKPTAYGLSQPEGRQRVEEEVREISRADRCQIDLYGPRRRSLPPQDSQPHYPLSAELGSGHDTSAGVMYIWREGARLRTATPEPFTPLDRLLFQQCSGAVAETLRDQDAPPYIHPDRRDAPADDPFLDRLADALEKMSLPFETWRAVLDLMHTTSGAAHYSLNLFDGSEFTRALTNRANADVIQPRKNGLSRHVVDTGQTLIIPDARHDPRFQREMLNYGVRSSLCLPLKRKHQVLGVLWLHFDQLRTHATLRALVPRLRVGTGLLTHLLLAYTEPRALSDAGEPPLLAADPAARKVYQARMRQNEPRMKKLNRLNEMIQNATHRPEKLQPILDRLAWAAQEAVGFQHGGMSWASLHLLENNGERVQLRQWAYSIAPTDDTVERRHPNDRLKLPDDWQNGQEANAPDAHPFLRVLISRDPYVVSDIAQTPHAGYRTRLPLARTCLVLPIIFSNTDDTLGVLSIEHTEPHAIDENLLQFLMSTARTAYTSIQTHRQYLSSMANRRAIRALIELDKLSNRNIPFDQTLFDKVALRAWEIFTSPRNDHISYVARVDEDADALVFVASYPPARIAELRAEQNESLPLHNPRRDMPIGISVQTVLTGEMQCVGNVHEHSSYLEDYSHIQSSISVPIQVRGTTIGVIVVEHPELNAFSDMTCDVLQRFADLMAAIWLRHDSQHPERTDIWLLEHVYGSLRSHFLESFYQAAQAILRADMDLEATLQSIADSARDLHTSRGHQAAYSHIILVDRHGQYEPRVVSPSNTANAKRFKEMIKGTLAGRQEKVGMALRALQTGTIQHADNVRENPDYIKFKKQTKSAIAIPISSAERVIGVINLEFDVLAAFDKRDEALYKSLAALAAIEIEKTWQHEDLRRASQYRRVINETISIVSGSIRSDRQDWLHAVLSNIVSNFLFAGGNRAILGVIQTYEPQTPSLQVADVYPPEQRENILRYTNGGRRALDERRPVGISGRAVITRQIQNVPDVRGHKDYIEFDPQTRSEIDVPIVYKDTVLGVLTLESQRAHAFDEIDEMAVRSIADHLAIAMQNRIWYEEKKRTQDVRDQNGLTMAWLQITTDIWRHQIHGNAINIRNATRRMWRKLEKANAVITPELQQIIDVLRLSETEAENIIQLPVTPRLSDRSSWETIDVAALLQERIQRLYEYYYHIDLAPPDFEIEGEDLTIDANRLYLRYGIDYVIDNAIDAMQGTHDRRLMVTVTRQNEWLVLRFLYDARFLTVAERHLLDTRGDVSYDAMSAEDDPPTSEHANEDKPDRDNARWRMLLAHQIVEAFGGKLSLTKEAERLMTQITIRLPWKVREMLVTKH